VRELEVEGASYNRKDITNVKTQPLGIPKRLAEPSCHALHSLPRWHPPCNRRSVLIRLGRRHDPRGTRLPFPQLLLCAMCFGIDGVIHVGFLFARMRSSYQ
jgi:hypothetical protein